MDHTAGATPTPTPRRLNSYERSRLNGGSAPRAWLPQFSRDALIGGLKSHELARHLRLHVPHRTSRYHEAIEQDAGHFRRFLESLGYTSVGASYAPTMFARPGQAWPDVYTDGGSYLVWSTSELPGTLAVVPVNIDGSGCVELFVADVVSLTLAHRFNGDEQAMLAAHLQER